MSKSHLSIAKRRTERPAPLPFRPRTDREDEKVSPDSAQAEHPVEHEGATEEQTGDRTGPAVGYDEEPEQVRDPGGVS